jgi:hypothetical protein
MSADDYNPLPKLIINDIELEMTGPLREKYDQMERELFLHIDSCGKDIEIFNQVALMAKCLQYGNGAIYPVSGAAAMGTHSRSQAGRIGGNNRRGTRATRSRVLRLP